MRASTALLACALVGAVAQSASGAAHPASAYQELADAVRRGDASAARDLARAVKMDPVFIRLMSDQLEYDMPKLLSDALACRDAFVGKHAMPSARGCNLAAYYAALVLGDARGAFQALHWVRDVGGPAVNQASGMTERFHNAFDRVDVGRLARELPLTSIELDPEKTSVAYLNPPCQVTGSSSAYVTACNSAAATRPEVKIVVNGKRTAALLDTGTPFAIVMSHSRAKALGMTPIVTGLGPVRMLGKAPPADGNSSLYLTDTLSFGSLSARHLMAVVVPDSVLEGTGVVIGLPTLARFGEVTFGRSGITLGVVPTKCGNRLPLTFASPSSQQGKLVFPAEADGKHVSATIDTGSSAALIAGRALNPSPVASSSSGPQKSSSRGSVLHRYLNVSLGKVQFKYDNAPVIPSLTVPDVVIGAPILSMMNVQMNFSKMWLCMSPTAPTQVPHRDPHAH